MFFAIFRRKFIAQCRSSVRYGLNQYAARSQRFKEVMKSMMHTSNFYLPHFMFFFAVSTLIQPSLVQPHGYQTPNKWLTYWFS